MKIASFIDNTMKILMMGSVPGRCFRLVLNYPDTPQLDSTNEPKVKLKFTGCDMAGTDDNGCTGGLDTSEPKGMYYLNTLYLYSKIHIHEP